MKKFWFYIEPYSFIFEGKQGLLLYNTLNGKASLAKRNHCCPLIIAKRSLK